MEASGSFPPGRPARRRYGVRCALIASVFLALVASAGLTGAVDGALSPVHETIVAVSSATSCPSSVVKNTTLSTDCSGSMSVTGTGITLNCDEHIVSGARTQIGITLGPKAKRDTVTNCKVEGFGTGVLLNRTSKDRVSNVTDTGAGAVGVLLNSTTSSWLVHDSVAGKVLGFALNSSSHDYVNGSSANTTNQVGFYLGGSSAWDNLTGDFASHDHKFGYDLESVSHDTVRSGSAIGEPLSGYAVTQGRDDTLVHDTASSDEVGFYLSDAASDSLTSDTSSSGSIGFLLNSSSSHNTLTSDRATKATTYGFLVLGGDANKLVSDNGSHSDIGILLELTEGASVTKSVGYANSFAGIGVAWATKTKLTSDSFHANGVGTYVDNGSQNSFSKDNDSGNADSGLILFATDKNSVTGETANDDGVVGAFLNDSDSNTLSKSEFNGSEVGVGLNGSSLNAFSQDNSSGNSAEGFGLDWSSSNQLTHDVADSDGSWSYVLADGSDNNLSNDSASVSTDGFSENVTEGDVYANDSATGDGAGFISSDSEQSVYSNDTSDDTGTAFGFVWDTDVFVANSSATTYEYFGFWSDESAGVNMQNDAAVGTGLYYGFFIDSSSGAVIEDSSSSGGTIGFAIGQSSSNTLESDTATSGGTGFEVDLDSSSNELTDDLAEYNDGWGFYVSGADNDFSSDSALGNGSYGILDNTIGSETDGTSNYYVSNGCSGNNGGGSQSSPVGLC